MFIENARVDDYVVFNDLEPGDVFESGSSLLMKMHGSDEYNAVSLEFGYVVDMPLDGVVKLVSAKIVVID